MITFCALAYTPDIAISTSIPETTSDAAGLVIVARGSTTFTYFSKLPVELRLRIWGFACFLTRNLNLSAKAVDSVHISQSLNFYKYSSSTPPPAILHVSKEARNEALRHYNLTFDNTICLDKEVIMRSVARIYFNPAADRVCISRSFHWSAFEDLQFKDVRRMAVNVAYIDEPPESVSFDASTSTPEDWFHGGIQEVVIFHHEPDKERMPKQFELHEPDECEKLDGIVDRRIKRFRELLDACITPAFGLEENEFRDSQWQKYQDFEQYSEEFVSDSVQEWNASLRHWKTKWEAPVIKVMKVKEVGDA